MSIFDLFAKTEPLKTGDPAPMPAAVDQDGSVVDFATVYAKGVTLIYFYPKADTPGCTAQACSLRDSFADLAASGIQILGVSRDGPRAQRAFQDKYRLPFPLIADADGSVAKAFRVGLYPIVGVTRRQAFLVKEERIVWVQAQAATSGHAAEVRAAIASLKNV